MDWLLSWSVDYGRNEQLKQICHDMNEKGPRDNATWNMV